MRAQHLPAWEYRRMRWANHRGWTREIVRDPPGDGAFDWRLSIAEIDHDCDYSAYPGMHREQVLLEGVGYRLDFADGRSLDVQPPHGRAQFEGDAAPACRLESGPVRVFNLIHDPDRIVAQVHHRPLVGSLVVFVEPRSRWLLFLLSGNAHVREPAPHSTLTAGDSLLLANDDSVRQRALIEGGGEALLLRLSPPA